MFCNKCGKQLEDGAMYCPDCGQSFAAEQSYVVPMPPVEEKITAKDLPEQYRPLSAWAYFGLQILFAIPVVGFIFLIIFSISKGNLNRRSFARSYWCALIVVGIILAVILVLGLLTGGAIGLFESVRF